MGGRSRGAARASATLRAESPRVPPVAPPPAGTCICPGDSYSSCCFVCWVIKIVLLLVGPQPTGQAPKGTSHDQPSGQLRISVFDPYSATIARLSDSPTTHDCSVQYSGSGAAPGGRIRRSVEFHGCGDVAKLAEKMVETGKK
jgi:hypothetical protein